MNTENGWPRNLSTGPGDGLFTGTVPYISNIPYWPFFVRELEARGYQAQAELICHYLLQKLWSEKFF